MYCKIFLILINWLVIEKVNSSKISITPPTPNKSPLPLCILVQHWSCEDIRTVSFKWLNSHAASKMFICRLTASRYYGWDLPSSQALTRMLAASCKLTFTSHAHRHEAIASTCHIPRKPDVWWCNFLNNCILNRFGVWPQTRNLICLNTQMNVRWETPNKAFFSLW